MVFPFLSGLYHAAAGRRCGYDALADLLIRYCANRKTLKPLICLCLRFFAPTLKIGFPTLKIGNFAKFRFIRREEKSICRRALVLLRCVFLCSLMLWCFGCRPGLSCVPTFKIGKFSFFLFGLADRRGLFFDSCALRLGCLYAVSCLFADFNKPPRIFAL